MNPLRAVLCLLLMAHAIRAASLSFGPGQPVPALDSLFQSTNDWIGADGDYTVALSSRQILWLFSDTWIGQVRDHKRTHAQIVNNTIALQTGRGPDAKVQFFVRRDDQNHPTAFFTPADHHGWFWLQSAALSDDKLFLFLMQVEKTDTKSVFGFRQCGQWLGIITNPFAPPLDWHVSQLKLPSSAFDAERHTSYGSATLIDGGFLYVYGTEEPGPPHPHGRQMVVARVPTNSISDFSTWRFYSHDRWITDSTQATGVCGGIATEFSVSYLPNYHQYVLVYTDHGLSPDIQVRTADHPWGSWSSPTTAYQCPEMLHDKGVFCYAAKAHPSLARADELIITYAANTYDISQTINDATLYWPRFVRVPISVTGAPNQSWKSTNQHPVQDEGK